MSIESSSGDFGSDVGDTIPSPDSLNISDFSGKIIKVLLESPSQSFRAFAANIQQLKKQGLLFADITPCASTIANWLKRISVAKINDLSKAKEPCIDIIDHCIGVGNIKLFVISRLYESVVNECYKQKKHQHSMIMKLYTGN